LFRKETLEKLQSVLPHVQKPARYIGGEANCTIKNATDVSYRVALAFPDVYEVAFSHIGLKILYQMLNRRDDCWAERVYCPWPDMEKRMRDAALPLYTLESLDSVDNFDLIGFSLQHELNYSNILTMLDLAGIPLRSALRSDLHPIIIGGGPGAANPEPVADFFDALYLGEAEDGLDPMVDFLIDAKKRGLSRSDKLLGMAQLHGVYVPSLWAATYGEDGAIIDVKPLVNNLPTPARRIATDFNAISYPEVSLIPNIEPVHDRYSVEIQRGCSRGCRFCQAGMIYRPTRQRAPQTVISMAGAGIEAGGHDTLGLLSLSASDYACLEYVMSEIYAKYESRNISVQLPSLRVEGITPELVRQMERGRKGGFTLAPEAATDRLRAVINKGNTEDELLASIEKIAELGWRHVKLYFMIGLPTETDEDRMAIVDLCRKVRFALRKYDRNAGIAVSVSTFVPKPQTPFQWVPMLEEEQVRNILFGLKDELQKMRIEFRWHEIECSMLEGVMARGDRRLADVIEHAWRNGARYDGWNEHMRYDIWLDAFKAVGIDPSWYRTRRYDSDDVLPWDHIDYLVSRKFLWHDYQSALCGAPVQDCTYAECSGCGVCDEESIKRNVYAPGGAVGDNAEVAEHVKTLNLIQTPPVAAAPTRILALRCMYSRLVPAAFIDHLQMVKIFFRAFSAAGIRVKYTNGHHPLPKFSFGQPLAVAVSSEVEYFDVVLEEQVTGPSLMKRVNRRLPEGVRVMSLQPLPESTPSISDSMESFTYAIDLKRQLSHNDIFECIERYNVAEDFIIDRIRKNKVKPVSLKRYVNFIDISGDSVVRCRIGMDLEGSVRLSEILEHVFNLDEEQRMSVGVCKVKATFKSRNIPEAASGEEF